MYARALEYIQRGLVRGLPIYLMMYTYLLHSTADASALLRWHATSWGS